MNLGQLPTKTYSSIEDLDADIKKYQNNIAGLHKILKVGSTQGQQLAAQKLRIAQKNLDTLLAKRQRLVSTGVLEGLGNCGSCGNCSCGGSCGAKGLGEFDGVVGSLVGNLATVAIIAVSLTAWIIQQRKESGGWGMSDGLQWYDILALPTNAVMIPLNMVADKISS